MDNSLEAPLAQGSRRWYWGLAALCIGALLVVWSVLIAGNQQLAEVEVERYEGERRVLTDLAAENLRRQLQHLDDALQLLRGEFIEDRKDVPRTIALLRQGPLQELGARMLLLDRDGRVVATDIPLLAGKPTSLAEQDYFVHFANGGKDRMRIDGPLAEPVSGTPGILFSRPILDHQGKFAGVVAFIMEPLQLTAFVQHLDLGADGLLTLYSTAGRVLSRSRDLDKLLGKQLTEEQFAPFLHTVQGVLTRRSALDGVKRVVSYRWLEQYPLLVLVSASPVERDAGIATQQRDNVQKGLLLTLLVLLTWGFFAYHLGRRDRLEWQLARQRGHLMDAQRVACLGSWERDIPLDKVWWSEQIYTILGYSPLSQTPSYDAFLAVIHPEDRAWVDEAFVRTRETGCSLDLSCRLLLPAGIERYVRLSGRVEWDAQCQPKRLVGTLQDVSEAMALQHALAEAEERWKFALEGSGEGVWDWNVAEHKAYLSPRWKAILGYQDHEVPNRHEEFLERLHPEDRDRVMAATTDHFAGRTPVFQEEFRLRHRDGSYRWVLSRGQVFARDDNGRPLRMLGTITDISERKQSELALAESEAMQRSLVSALAEGVVVQDREGRIVSANAAARRILRLSEERLLGRHSRDAEWLVVRENGAPFPADEHPAMITLRTGVSCDNVIMGVERPANGRVWLSVNSRPLVHAGEDHPYAVVTSFVDISDIKAAELANRLYRDVLERAARAIVVTDMDARIDNVNSAFVALLGYSREECIGNRAGFYRSNRHDRAFFQQLWQSLKEHGEWQGEVWNRRKTGEAILLAVDIRAITNDQGTIRQFVAIYQDVTELRRSQEEMWRRAHYDPLTGLPNRSLFLERLDQALAQARRQGDGVGLLYMDLDGFKAINDTHGHQAGDAVLQEVGQRLQGLLRSSDTVARLAGDEFTALLPHLTVEERLEPILQAIHNAIRQPILWHGLALQVDISIGSATFPDQADDRESLIGAADKAMYDAKQQARLADGQGAEEVAALASAPQTTAITASPEAGAPADASPPASAPVTAADPETLVP